MSPPILLCQEKRRQFSRISPEVLPPGPILSLCFVVAAAQGWMKLEEPIPGGPRGWGGRTRIVPGGKPPGGAQVGWDISCPKWLGHFLWNQESSADPLSIPALPEWAVEGVWASRGQRGVLEVSALPRARHLRLPAAILEKASGRQALLCIPWIPLLVHQHSALPQPSAAPRTRIACL